MPRDAKSRVEAQEGMALPDALLATLRKHRGNVSAVAAQFRVDRKTVYAWMDDYGIERTTVVTAS